MSTPKNRGAKQQIYYRAVKVISKPTKVEFTTKDGRKVTLKGIKAEAHKMLPRPVKKRKVKN